MERDSYLDRIRSAWLGEQFGEVFFLSMAERAEDPAMQEKWRTLARLEHVTGQTMAGVLQAYGENPETEDEIAVSEDVLTRYTQVPFHDALQRMKGTIEAAIVRFDQLLADAPEDDVTAVQFLVEHEQALLNFVDRELAGESARSLEHVEALLGSA